MVDNNNGRGEELTGAASLAGNERATELFDYEVLAARLAVALGIDPARLPGSPR